MSCIYISPTKDLPPNRPFRGILRIEYLKIWKNMILRYSIDEDLRKVYLGGVWVEAL